APGATTGSVSPELPSQPESAVAPWPPSTPRERKSSGRLRSTLVGALVGGLVGALAAGGLVLAFAGGGDTTTVVQPASGEAIVTRPSTEISRTGDVAAIIQKDEPAIVAITTGGGPGSGNGGAGTGFVITQDGYIVTNNHVAESAAKIEVAFTNGEIASAKIVGTDPSADLAVLKVDRTGLPTVELGDSDAVQVGDEVVAIGNALALEGGLSVTRGIISGTDRDVDTEVGSSLVGMLQTDAAINPGNSGGPLLDAQGRVLGINTAIANPASAQNVGFAIPISRAKPIIEDLRLGRAATFLGVSTRNVTPAAARELDLKVDAGAYVAKVTAGTPAKDAGIQEGDVIVEIGGKTIEDSGDVQTAVREHRPGDKVTVVVDRKGERKTLDATLTERPAA
ncbi:MAG: trypsin-like peptidase domain-containing protein, partial [Acidimicrobiia bacterium]|nr:trypsin-like peptidase domain-containing protein [Acidimicrobiia bacterium]